MHAHRDGLLVSVVVAHSLVPAVTQELWPTYVVVILGLLVIHLEVGNHSRLSTRHGEVVFHNARLGCEWSDIQNLLLINPLHISMQGLSEVQAIIET